MVRLLNTYDQYNSTKNIEKTIDVFKLFKQKIFKDNIIEENWQKQVWIIKLMSNLIYKKKFNKI